MPRSVPPRVLAALLIALALCLVAAAPPPVLGRKGLVAADHRLASEAGAAALAAGGNAVDAVVAAALAGGVVQPSASGLGGGGFALVVTPDGERSVLDFREVAPAAATRDMYVDAPADDASRVGGLAVAVPSEAMGLDALHARYGVLPRKQVAQAAWVLAERGFRVGAHLAGSLARMRGAETLARGLFGAPVPREGDVVRRSRLAASIQAFGAQGAAAFRDGWIAQDVVSAAQAAGGVLTAEDLAAYQPRDRTPLVGSYRGWTVVTMPPPSSGGAVLLQALGVLEGTDLAALGHNSSALLHLYAETLQHAYADRAEYMGDPDRVEIPMDRLLSSDRIAAVRASFDPERTLDADAYGMKTDLGKDGGTHHISVIDADGMSVALTTTVNTPFGSQVIAPKSGIVLNNEMDDFVARPGVPNAFGLVGTEANAVAPGARPLSSMTPTVLLSPDGATRIAVGASGGPFIISSTMQAIINLIDFGMDPSAAVAAPRVHHQWAPRLLFVDEGIPADVVSALEARGHTVKQMPFFSCVQAVRWTPGEATGASDPRKGGWPAGPEAPIK